MNAADTYREISMDLIEYVIDGEDVTTFQRLQARRAFQALKQEAEAPQIVSAVAIAWPSEDQGPEPEPERILSPVLSQLTAAPDPPAATVDVPGATQTAGTKRRGGWKHTPETRKRMSEARKKKAATAAPAASAVVADRPLRPQAPLGERLEKCRSRIAEHMDAGLPLSNELEGDLMADLDLNRTQVMEEREKVRLGRAQRGGWTRPVIRRRKLTTWAASAPRRSWTSAQRRARRSR